MLRRHSLALVANALMLVLLPAEFSAKSLGWNADALSVELGSVQQLSTPPEGVAELKFADFYHLPVGERGLEYSARMRQLDGKRVRILGFMVKQSRPAMGVALLTPYATATHEGEYGLCEDLPPTTLFIEVPRYRGIAVPFTSGPLLLTGTLQLGRREEADGRVSYARLTLDPEVRGESTTPAAARAGQPD